MTTFTEPTATMRLVLDQALSRYHERLINAEVSVYLLAALSPRDREGNIVGPALKHHGVEALAVVRIVKHAHRVAGLGDAEIRLDADAWETMSNSRRTALLDHELTHIELLQDEDGKVKLDAGGRPRLKIRPHDHQHGWFDEVAERHGASSHEVVQARQLLARSGQLYFPGLEPRADVGRDPRRVVWPAEGAMQ